MGGKAGVHKAVKSEAQSLDANEWIAVAKSAERFLPQYAKEQNFPKSGIDVLRASLYGIPRTHLAEHLGRSENTIKSQVRILLQRTGYPTLTDLLWAVRMRSRDN